MLVTTFLTSHRGRLTPCYATSAGVAVGFIRRAHVRKGRPCARFQSTGHTRPRIGCPSVVRWPLQTSVDCAMPLLFAATDRWAAAFGWACASWLPVRCSPKATSSSTSTRTGIQTCRQRKREISAILRSHRLSSRCLHIELGQACIACQPGASTRRSPKCSPWQRKSISGGPRSTPSSPPASPTPRTEGYNRLLKQVKRFGWGFKTASIRPAGYDSIAPATSGPQPRFDADCPVKVEEPVRGR